MKSQYHYIRRGENNRTYFMELVHYINELSQFGHDNDWIFMTVFSQLLHDLWKLQNKLVNSFQYLKICLFSPFWGSLFCLSTLPFSLLRSFHCFQEYSGNLRLPTRGRQHAGIALIHYLCLFMFGWLWLYRKIPQWLLFF